MRVALSSIDWKTGSSSPGDVLMTRNTSAEAFSRSSASSRSRVSWKNFVPRLVAIDRCLGVDCDVLARFDVAALRPSVLPARPRAFERRFIALPLTEDNASYRFELALGKWPEGTLRNARPCPLWVISCRATRLGARPLYPRKQPRHSLTGVSALGQKQTLRSTCGLLRQVRAFHNRH
jgi:hypothetical protein